MNKILIATTNEGKVKIYKQFFENKNIEVLSLNDLNITTSPEENGKNVIENALIKAEYYHKLSGLPVISNDSGLIIKKFKKHQQPGLLVRRHNGKDLTDQELIDRYCELLNKVGGKSKAYYDVGLVAINEKGKAFVKRTKHHILLLNKPSGVIEKGVPLNSLSYMKKQKKYMTDLTQEEKHKLAGRSYVKQDKFFKKVFKNIL